MQGLGICCDLAYLMNSAEHKPDNSTDLISTSPCDLSSITSVTLTLEGVGHPPPEEEALG